MHCGRAKQAIHKALAFREVPNCCYTLKTRIGRLKWSSQMKHTYREIAHRLTSVGNSGTNRLHIPSINNIVSSFFLLLVLYQQVV